MFYSRKGLSLTKDIEEIAFAKASSAARQSGMERKGGTKLVVESFENQMKTWIVRHQNSTSGAINFFMVYKNHQIRWKIHA
jgi:hypothetical protein